MKRALSVFLAFMLTLTCLPATSLAAPDPYKVSANHVQELVDLDADSIASLSLADVSNLFGQAFNVSSDIYTEEQIRSAVQGLSFALKAERLRGIVASSTQDGTTYDGDVGLAWIRDTVESPLTLGEILAGYTLEVDYLCWETVATLLATSSSEVNFLHFLELLLVGASGAELGAAVVEALKLTGITANIATLVVATACAFGWDYLKSIDRQNMQRCFSDMSQSDMMEVHFAYTPSIGMVTKIYSCFQADEGYIENPFPTKYGEWRFNEYACLYSY